jgi:DNA polymerase V
VIAQVNGEFTVKELALTPEVQLIPRNKAYLPITFTDDAELALFGVVTNIVRQMTRSKRAQ